MAQENVKWKKRQIFDKCFVEIAVFSRPLTFPADRAIIKTRGDARYEQAPPRGGNPTVATQHKTYWLERLALKTVSRLLAQTAHFFLSCVSRRYSTRDTMPAMEPNAPRTVKSIEVICIASPEMNFPRGLIHASIPLSRDGRQPSFTAHRLQGGKNSTGTVGFHGFYYTSKRANVKQIRALPKHARPSPKYGDGQFLHIALDCGDQDISRYHPVLGGGDPNKNV